MGDNKNILHILEKEAKPEGLSREAMEELREIFGTELTFVEAVNMIAAAIRNKDTAEAVSKVIKTNSADSETVFYGTKEVAEKLHCSIPTAREVMRRLDFPRKIIGGKWLVEKDAFKEWASARG